MMEALHPTAEKGHMVIPSGQSAVGGFRPTTWAQRPGGGF
ncbi:hypothetical protein BH23BAC3_BH23BAC3_05070 [soil metagenome]